MNVPRIVKTFANKTYELANKPGKMMLFVGATGWVLSSIAQVTAVVINKQIPDDQKKFLIPQEMSDACVNILSFILFTSKATSFGEGFVKRGKLATPTIKKFIMDNKLAEKVGQKSFDIKGESVFKNNPKFQEEYYKFADGVSFVSSVAGSIISCNIVTPLIRNKIASHFQKASLAREKELNQQKDTVITPQAPGVSAQNKPSVNNYKSATMNMPKGSLKI